MINDGINDVPDKTIAVFRQTDSFGNIITKDRFNSIIKKSEKKRDWFTPHFYRCLPLTIGNQYGFTIAFEFDFAFSWNGKDGKDDVKLTFFSDVNNDENPVYPQIATHFGSGILTVNPPFFFRTPPGVNLMTINPPNFVIPNVTVMTGVVETDNLRRNFTFNLKIQMPGIEVRVPAGAPLAAFIPVPRYYCDKFDMKFAEEIFSEDIIKEELESADKSHEYRTKVEPNLKHGVGKHYMLGMDPYGNKFKDHQKP